MANIPKGFGTAKDLLRRFKSARERRELWRSLHQEAFDFAAPQRETFRFRSPGQRKNRHIFDSTAVDGLEQFASVIQGSMVPSWQPWAELVSGSEIPEEEKDKTNQLLGDATKQFFASLNHSNFSTEITPAFSDLGIGTGAIIVEEGEFAKGEDFEFTNVPLAELYPETPANGSIDSAWRQQEVEPRHIERIWPGADLPPSLETAKKNKPEEKIKLLNAMLFNPDDGRYHQIVMHEASKHVLFTQSFKTKRLIVFRWHVVPGETFGRGPVIQKLPDIRTVNKMVQFILENAALQIAGVYTGVDDGIFNPHTVRISPGTVIPVASNGTQNPSLKGLERSGDLGLGDALLGQLQEGIRKSLLSSPLGEVTDPVKSATEQQLRMQEFIKRRGASVGRMKSELIEPLVAAGIDILSGLGKIAAFEVDGKQVTIKQASPLSKAEDLEDFQNLQVWMGFNAQLPPEVVAGAVKVEDIPKFSGEKLGLPPELFRTDEERKELAAQVQEAAEAQIEQPQQG